MKNKSLLRILLALTLLAAGHTVFYFSFVAHWIFEVYLVSVVLLGASFGALLWGLARRRLFAVLGGAAMAGLLFGVATFCRTVVDWREWVVALIFLGITCAATVACLLRRPTTGKPLRWPAPAAVAVTLLIAAIFYGSRATDAYYRNYDKKAASPAAGQAIAPPQRPLAENADLYVSPEGSDDNDGSLEKPLATIEKARDLVRAMDKTGKTGVTVALKAGEYRVTSLAFTAEDSGTESCPVTYTAYGDGKAVLNGGVTLPRDSFAAVTDEAVLERLSDDAQKNVLSVDLFALGITAEQYGKLYAIGNSTQAGKYDGDWTGPLYCELFIDDARQTIARSPNGA
ncbi:MAG: hypothetical protein IJK98_04355, partial [Clostridia bacterium]|nr:hypothetical protein [Clostridia bacterium]